MSCSPPQRQKCHAHRMLLFSWLRNSVLHLILRVCAAQMWKSLLTPSNSFLSQQFPYAFRSPQMAFSMASLYLTEFCFHSVLFSFLCPEWPLIEGCCMNYSCKLWTFKMFPGIVKYPWTIDGGEKKALRSIFPGNHSLKAGLCKSPLP